MINKLITFEDAASLVFNGAMLALGGMTIYRRPMAFTRALIQRWQKSGEPGNLTLLTFTASLESDLLVGTQIVNRVRTCYFGMEIFGLAPMFTFYANHGEIEVIEETEASLSFGLNAQAATVGFLPGRAWLGTDLPKLRPDVRTIIDPYSGEELIAFPAIHPDIAVIHALSADFDGNALIGDNKGVDEELAITSKTVIITAEEVVPELSKADITAPFVHAVVKAPRGALPTSCHPLYPLDGNMLLEYTESVSDPATFSIFLNRFLREE
jgi:glutaconate CoA-transferase subunit A